MILIILPTLILSIILINNMIIFYVGGIGSGKTISMIKESVERKSRSYTNYKLYNIEEYKQLKVSDLIKITEDKKAKKKKYQVNFDYWNQQLKKDENFDIYLDELHNIANSRTGAKKLNVGLNMWVAQVRKILQGNEDNNIYICTQRPMSVDIGWRDLAHAWIVCNKTVVKGLETKTELYNGKVIKLPVCVVKRRYFDSLKKCMDYMQLGIDQSFKKDKFIANKYYKYYNTQELITFGEKYL